MYKRKEYPIKSYVPMRTNKDRACICCGDTIPAGSSRMIPRHAKANHGLFYKITLTREQLMLISRCVEDISRYAAGDMDLQHTTETLINDMDRTETLGIRSFIVNNSRAIRRRLFPDLEDFEHIGYDGGSKDKINRKRLIGNTYQIYRSILHQLAIDEDWNNVYSDITLPSGDMGTIKVERIDDDKKDNDIK